MCEMLICMRLLS